MSTPTPSQHRLISRPEIKSLIAKGHKIFIFNNTVIKADAWLPFHPGGEKSILHMIGRDATDEINALHSEQARELMRKYVVGKIEGRWENFLPPIQGGKYRVVISQEVADESLYGKEDSRASENFTSPLPVFHTGEIGTERTPAISTDLSRYPSLDRKSQDEIVLKYRQLDEKLRSEGLYNCPYSSYGIDIVRYGVLFALFWKFLQSSYYAVSGLFLGLFWHQLVFTAHDAGHMGITHGFHTDSCIEIFIADFLGGLFIGWWKRNHNIHHIVTNSPEHDPDIEHMPFFAISHRFFSSLFSTYYDRNMKFDAASRFFIKHQTYLYYPILLLGRFNLYVLAWSYLLNPSQAPRKGPAWWHRHLEIAGQIFFWYWFGYQTLYLRIPTWSSRIAFILISHMITAPLHVQLTLSHFAMLTADLGVRESFPMKMLRTTMDVECPPWMDFLHGGLQFQVVHHLCPQLPRHNLRKAQKYVREFCEDVGVPYVIFGFVRGNKEVIGRLGEVAAQLRVFEECKKVAARDLVEGHVEVPRGMTYSIPPTVPILIRLI